MELDDLKQAWNRSSENIQRGNRDILELIQNSSDSPLARLQKRFKRGMVMIPVVAAITFSKLLAKPDFMHIMIASFIGVFCLVMMIYFFIGYKQTSAMQIINDDVKTQLQRQVRLLRNGLLWRRLITRGMILLYCLILEALMYFRPDPALTKWQSQPLTLRLSVYAGIYLIIYLITKFALNHRYKKHITRLEELLRQI